MLSQNLVQRILALSARRIHLNEDWYLLSHKDEYENLQLIALLHKPTGSGWILFQDGTYSGEFLSLALWIESLMSLPDYTELAKDLENPTEEELWVYKKLYKCNTWVMDLIEDGVDCRERVKGKMTSKYKGLEVGEGIFKSNLCQEIEYGGTVPFK